MNSREGKYLSHSKKIEQSNLGAERRPGSPDHDAGLSQIIPEACSLRKSPKKRKLKRVWSSISNEAPSSSPKIPYNRLRTAHTPPNTPQAWPTLQRPRNRRNCPTRGENELKKACGIVQLPTR